MRKDTTVQTKKDKREVEEPEAPAGDRPRIVWDDANMRSTYANVVNVSSTREEVTLLFGTNQTWQTGQKQFTIQLSDRIILSPFAAKRLSILLTGVVREYEKRFGQLQIEGEPTAS